MSFNRRTQAVAGHRAPLRAVWLLISVIAALVAACSDGTDVAASQTPLATQAAPAAPASPAPAAAPVVGPPAPPPVKTVWILMRQQAALAQARATHDWKTRGQLVYAALTSTATSSQASLLSMLATRGISHKPFWIVNTVRVTADQATIDEIGRRPDVARVVPDQTYHIPPLTPGNAQQKVQTVEWNLANIRVPEAWEQFGSFGDGIVVANVDTGVQFDHPALVEQYRGNLGGGAFDHNYNWFDPANICGFPSVVPCDNVQHGTHTMGTMVGDDHQGNQIGVAPHAKWIAAKGCEFDSCTNESLLAAGQWILAPTDLTGQNPRPELRPHVVNNSWGDGPTDPFYQATTQAWVAAGIFPAFANGNAGPSCGSASAPGDLPEAYGVGAYDINNQIAFFSGRGPSAIDGAIKPNLSAPGVDVRSSVPFNSYAIFSGTSMATPHVAGSVALLWSAAPALLGDVEGTRAILDATGVDTSDVSCGGTPENNNVFGQGRLDAFEGVNQSPRGPSGTLQGTVVTASGGEPIARASIHAVGPFDRTTFTDPAGAYRMVLPEGAYDVSAGAFGYITQTAPAIQIPADTTVEQSFSLVLAPSFPVTGFVRSGTGEPIVGAQVTILNTPIPAAITDADGHYVFESVPAGDYQVRAQAGGCFDSQISALTVDDVETLDFVLPTHVDGFGYSCRNTTYNFIEANTVLPISGEFGLASVRLPFAFPFYGQLYSTADVGTSGYLSFQTGFFDNTFNVGIPDLGIPNAAIYPFWDDLIVDSLASVRTETVGTAPNRQFVIEWRDVTPFGFPSLRIRFEIVLYESGQIVLQYFTADPDPIQKGGSATAGIENELGTIGLQYSFNEPVLRSGLAVLYNVPPSGLILGTVTDANDGSPISGAQVAALQNGEPVRKATTDARGNYQFVQLPVGDYVIEASATNYTTDTFAVSLTENATIQHDFVLRTGRASVTPSTLQVTIPSNQTRTRTLTLSNTGSASLDFTIHEAGGGRQATPASAAIRAAVAAAKAASASASAAAINPNAFTTRDYFTSSLSSQAAIAPLAAGDVIRSWPATGLSLAWGLGYTGNLWVSDAIGLRNTEFTPLGAATGRGWPTSWASVFPGDSTYLPNRNLVCQVNVGGDNGIYCWDPNSGEVVNSITGPFPWTAISQRGLAYRSDDDSFYIGGWNDFTIYHIRGLSSATPGEVISSCQPADGVISGLAYNDSVNVLWEATNSPTDTMYELNPEDCTVLSTLAHPAPLFNGAGLEMEETGNLYLVAQNLDTVYLIDSGVPAFTDVPWLSVTPESGSLAAGAKQSLQVTFDTHGLTPGLYLASVFIKSNAARESLLRVPVSLLVPDYQQAVNAGGKAYVDSLGDTWAADRAFTTGQWGYVQKSKTDTTKHAIAGTSDPVLFQSQRIDPYAYRFDNVPNGVYQVDLRFAELATVGLGDRLFDVIIEDSLVLPAHDIAYEVGRFVAESRTFFVDVADGHVDVRLIPHAGLQLPVINALRVTHRNDR